MPSLDRSVPEGSTAIPFPPWMEEPGNVHEQVLHTILPYPEAKMSIVGMEEEILLVDTFLQDEPLVYGGIDKYGSSK